MLTDANTLMHVAKCRLTTEERKPDERFPVFAVGLVLEPLTYDLAKQLGADAIGDVEPLPTGRELGRYWLNHPSFGKAEQAILGALLNHPKGLDADGLCKATGYEYSGGFRNALSALRTAGVLVGKNTEVMRASEELFG